MAAFFVWEIIMLSFKDFLSEKFDAIGAIESTEPLEHHSISPIETHYKMPLTDSHKLVVMFNPPRHGQHDHIEVNWKFEGVTHFPESEYNTTVHKKVMGGVGKAIQQHLQSNPHIRVVSGFAMTPGLDRSYEKTLSKYASKIGGRYTKSKTPFSAVLGTHQHNLILPSREEINVPK